MTTNHFIAAIELGSSTIAGIAGRKTDDGSLQVLAYVHEDSSAFVRRGAIYNIDKAANAVKSIVGKLEAQLPASVAKVYVGIGGQSLRTVKNLVSRTLAEEGIISQELVDSLTDENLAQPVVDMTILDVVPQEYKIGNNLTVDPVGVYGRDITGQFLNIIARSSLKKNLEQSFEQAKVEIADFAVAPMVLANAVLTESEMRAGCALIDIGADTTTVQVYKNNLLRSLCVLPLGGSNITRDLTTLQIEEEEAEELKLQHGDALYEEEEGDEEALPSCSLKDGRTIELRMLNDIVGARMEEILANAWNQIQLSGYEGKLFSGLVLTGGGADLKNTEAALRKLSKVEKIRTARRVQGPVQGDENEHYRNTLLGLLLQGRENCDKEVPQPEKPVEQELFAKEEIETVEKPKPADDNSAKKNNPDKEPHNDNDKKPKKKKWGIGELFNKVQNEFLNTDDNSSKMD